MKSKKYDQTPSRHNTVAGRKQEIGLYRKSIFKVIQNCKLLVCYIFLSIRISNFVVTFTIV